MVVLQQQYDAGEMAVAMAAAAEAATPNGCLEEALEAASVIWDRFSTQMLNASKYDGRSLQPVPHYKFAHLVHQLGAKKLALQIADKLKVS